MLPGKAYTVQDAIRLARTYGWIPAVAMVVGLFVALIVSSRLPNLYQSEMLVQIVPQRVPESYVRSTVTVRTEDRLEALTQQVLSRPRLEQLVSDFDLYREERVNLPMEDVVGMMRASAAVEPMRANRLLPAEAFYVRFSYRDATMAARVTERLGAWFIDENARDRGALAESTDTFLQTQLQQARAGLEAQEAKLETFRQRYAGRLPTQLAFNMQAMQNAQMRLQGLVEAAARDRDRRTMLERLYTELAAEPIPTRQAPPAAVARTGAPPVDVLAGATPEQQLTEMRANLQHLLLRFTPEHPDVQRARRLISEFEKKVAAAPAPSDPKATTPLVVVEPPEVVQRRERMREMRNEIDSLASQIARREAEDTRLRAQIEEYQTRIEAVPGVESESTALMRDYDTLQAQYRDLLQKSQSSKVATDLERRQIGEQFRILDPARVPGRPVSPNRLQINGIGAGIGLVLGLLIVAVLELRVSSFQSEAEVQNLLALPVVALVPFVESEAARKSRRVRRILVSASAIVAVGVGTWVFWSMQLWRFVA